MKYFIQFALIGLVCLLGVAVNEILPFPFPASVSGMVILFILLLCNIVKPCYIKETAELLQKNMALFFVPLVISVMENWDILKTVAFKLTLICLVATILTFIATAYTVKLTLKLQKIVGGRN